MSQISSGEPCSPIEPIEKSVQQYNSLLKNDNIKIAFVQFVFAHELIGERGSPLQ
jgi:hypothetical protein